MFQFLYGAIKTGDHDQNEYSRSRFQFLYGAIKTLSVYEKIGSLNRFNSSMVRLKHFSYIICNLFERFQFLYGAIKTTFPGIAKAMAEQVSIPLWCD